MGKWNVSWGAAKEFDEACKTWEEACKFEVRFLTKEEK